MAKKGNAKISKVKRNNQTTNKMKKQGKLKLQRHRTKIQKQKQPTQPQVEYSSDSDSASGDDWADMLDEEEQKYIMSRLAKQPQLLSNVPEKETENPKSAKRKRSKPNKVKNPVVGSDSGAESELDSDSDLEEKYEKKLAESPAKKLRPLLPIKTKEGLQERAEEVEDTESEDDTTEQLHEELAISEESDSDSGMEGTAEEGEATEGDAVTTVQLLADRRDRLKHDKLRIGALCSSLLESPEKKLKNLYPILYLMEERLKDGELNLHSVRKIATLSAYEVFRDILPDYMIRHQDYSNIKLKKDTLALYKYEKELLEFYKRYLQRLEKACGVLRRKKGDTRKLDDAATSLALVSLRCMCGLLTSRATSNYATNIAQSVVPFLDCRDREGRAAQIVTQACVEVFANDAKGEITLTIVRLINQLVKRRGDRLNPSALDCLLSLKIRDVDLDAEADLKNKKKREEKHKKRIVNLSKKEKKRAKKLKEVERELLETEAQEDEEARRKLLTEVTRTVFHIYFRLLKGNPRSGLLAAALDGIAKFTHVINVEYYSDLVATLARLVSAPDCGPRLRLQCARAVLRVQGAAGDVLRVDPAVFRAALYRDMLHAHAGSTHEDVKIVVEAVSQLTSRARIVSAEVLQAFGKRLGTVSAQLLHNGALAALLALHHLAQQSKAVSSLVETGESSGAAHYDPSLGAPEHSGAAGAVLYDLCPLRRHYHTPVRHLARALLQREDTPQHLQRLSPLQTVETYDGSQMSFKPAIPAPQSAPRKSRPTYEHVWAQDSLKHYCHTVESAVPLTIHSTS